MKNTFLKLDNHDFKLLSDLVYQRFGIYLPPQKQSLVSGRLQKTLKKGGFSSFRNYYDHLIREESAESLSIFVNQITTNFSFFYREKVHFDFFKQTLLPEMVSKNKKRGSNDLRFWSAGCSTCEEPYTLTMLMMEYFGMEYTRWDAGILATDISERALNEGIAATYSLDRVRQMPLKLRERYFTQQKNTMTVKDKVRKEVVIRRFNLMNSFPFKKQFQAIFCRNVMIYFDAKTRETLVQKFYNALEPGGYLFIGHSETIDRKTGRFSFVQPSLYRKPE